MSAMTTERFEGTCDVCGAAIALDWNPAEGIIDLVPPRDGQPAYTWIRHYATAPPGANPDCARYFSRVYEVSDPASEPKEDE